MSEIRNREMQLLRREHQRKCRRKHQRKDRRNRRKLAATRKQYFRRMRRRRYWTQRYAAAAVLVLTVLYLSVLYDAGERIFSVKEEYTAEIVLPAGEGGVREHFRVVFRWKTGELLLFHEEILRDRAGDADS